MVSKRVAWCSLDHVSRETPRQHPRDKDHFALRPQERGGLLGGGGGGGGGRERKSEGSTANTARKRPERPWTAARTMEVLKDKSKVRGDFWHHFR